MACIYRKGNVFDLPLIMNSPYLQKENHLNAKNPSNCVYVLKANLSHHTTMKFKSVYPSSTLIFIPSSSF